MDASKRKKVLRHILYALFLVLCGACPFFASWLPRRFGVEWIPGWPEFLSNLLTWGMLLIYLAVHIVKTWIKPLDEKFTKKNKRNTIIFYAIGCAFYIGMSALMGLGFQWRKIDRYIASPNGKNKAVIMVRKDDVLGDSWRTEYIYPVRAGLFYEDNNIYLQPGQEDITFTWLDDNTLEITRTGEWEDDNGEPTTTKTDLIRW